MPVDKRVNLNRTGRPKGIKNKQLVAIVNSSPNNPLFFKSALSAQKCLGAGGSNLVKRAVKEGKAVGNTKLFGTVIVYCGNQVKTSAEVMEIVGA
jgi:hypothetical protein